MPNRIVRSNLARAVGVALLTAAGQATAGGFMIVEQSVHEVGRAIAGASAAADNLGTLFFNPAGITRLEGTQGAAALHVIMPSAEFQGTRTSALSAPASGLGETDELGLAPNLYLVTDLNADLKFGLGINAPFGLVTDYDPGWVGRYHAIKSDLKTINLNPTLGYRASDRLSLGFGISAVYSDVELTNALDSVLVCTGLGGGSPAAFAACSAGLGTTAGSGAADGLARLEGNDWGFGFNLGLLYQVTDATRVGFAYRSRVEQTLTGTATSTFTLPGMGSVTSVRFIEADLTLPDSASIGIHHQLDAQWTVLADVAWNNWSEFDELRATNSIDGSVVLAQPEEWEDAWRYSLGLEYRPGSAWTFRGGVAFDETPIPSPELRTPRIPGEDRTWVAFGASYAASDNLSIDVAYAHLFVDDARINNTDASFGYTLTGDYENSVDIVSAQVSYRF